MSSRSSLPGRLSTRPGWSTESDTVRPVRTPWLGDACRWSTRSGPRAVTTRSPRRLHRGHRASPLNACSFTDFDRPVKRRPRPISAGPSGVSPSASRSSNGRPGLAVHGSLGHLQGPGRLRGRHVGRAPAHAGCHPGGSEHRAGIRRHELHLDRPARHDAESVEPRAHAGRVLRWHRPPRSREASFPSPPEARGGVHPWPGRVQRALRVQGDLWPDPEGTSTPASSR